MERLRKQKQGLSVTLCDDTPSDITAYCSTSFRHPADIHLSTSPLKNTWVLFGEPKPRLPTCPKSTWFWLQSQHLPGQSNWFKRGRDIWPLRVTKMFFLFCLAEWQWEHYSTSCTGQILQPCALLRISWVLERSLFWPSSPGDRNEDKAVRWRFLKPWSWMQDVS